MIVASILFSNHVIGMQKAFQCSKKNKKNVVVKSIGFEDALKISRNPSGIKLLECAESVRGKSLLEQNRYFLPSHELWAEKKMALYNSIMSSIQEGLSKSDLKILPTEIQHKIIDSLRDPMNLKCVNKSLYNAIQDIGIFNIFTVYWMQSATEIDFLLTHYVPVLLEEDSRGSKKFNIITPYEGGFHPDIKTSFWCPIKHYFKGHVGLKGFYESCDDKLWNQIYTLGLERVQQACKKFKIIGVDNDTLLSAIMCGNIDYVVKEAIRCPWGFTHCYIYNAMLAAIRYSDANNRMLECLLKENMSDSNVLRSCFHEDNKVWFSQLLCLADQYNNNAAFDILISMDPYRIKGKHWQNSFGISETFLDSIKNKLCPANIEKLRQAGYEETVTGKARNIISSIVENVRGNCVLQ